MKNTYLEIVLNGIISQSHFSGNKYDKTGKTGYDDKTGKTGHKEERIRTEIDHEIDETGTSTRTVCLRKWIREEGERRKNTNSRLKLNCHRRQETEMKEVHDTL